MFHNLLLGPSRRVSRGAVEERPYSPYDNPYLALWLDCSDESTLTIRRENGEEYVTEWRDKSGNNRHFAQETASEQPTLIRVNGSVDGVQFHEVNGSLLTTMFSLSELSVVGVWQPIPNVDNSYILGHGAARYVASRPSEFLFRTLNNTLIYAFNLREGLFYVQSVTRSGGMARAYTNGQESSTGPLENNEPFQISGFSTRSPGTGYRGIVREVIVRSAGNERYREQDEQYLLEKWGDRM